MKLYKKRSLSFLFDQEKVWALGFILVFLAGAYLRLRALTFQSYWDDELFSVAISDPANTLRQVVRLTISDVHPPLFQVLLWCWFKIFGFSETTGRLFPAIFGTCSIPVMFLLGRDIGNRKIGFISAIICAINIFHLNYSQEVRSYSLLFFLSALSLLFFVRVIKSADKNSLIAYIAASTALAYTHFFGLFVLAAEAIFFLIVFTSADANLKKAGIFLSAVLLATLLPLVPLVVKNAEIAAFWIKRPGPDFAIDYFREYFGSSLIAIGATLVLLIGIVRTPRDLEQRNFVRLFLLCLVVVLILPYVRSQMGTPMLTSRNTIAALPAIFILVAIGFAEIADGVFQAIALLVFSLLSILLIFHHPSYYRTVTKPQIREAAQALIAAKPDVDSVYAAQEVVRNFNIYFSLLEAPFRAQPIERLYQNNSEGGHQSVRLWLIDGRAGGPVFDQIVSSNKVRIIQEKLYLGSGFRLLELTE